MPLRPRPEIEEMVTASHGGPDMAELKALGLSPGEVIDFSVCSNPFPPPPEVKTAAAATAINRYPDSESTGLRERLSARLEVPVENILAGSGAMEIIRLIALAYFRPRDIVLVLEPTFGEYRVSCRIMGAEVAGQWAD